MLDTRSAELAGAVRLTRDEVARLEGREAARRQMNRHDNPYRSRSADGMSWHAGYDAEMAERLR